MFENPWIPSGIKDGLTTKQSEFLYYEGREALFGGAAGGGKSIALLIAALQWIDQPGYNALILRRTYKQLAKSDSILAKSKEWLSGKVRWNGDDHKWTFPNGNTLEFGHMDNADSIYNYQGGSWAFVGVDEATQFTEQMLAYPRTRQRRPAESEIPIRWRGASNPGGIGHDYVKARYVKDCDGKPIVHPERMFFPARIEDNPNIDREDYVKQLVESGIDSMTLAQLLKGDWDAVAGGRFNREWFRRYLRRGDGFVIKLPDVPERYAHPLKYIFQTCDPAASEKTSADFTVVSTWGVTDRNELLWIDCQRFQRAIPDIPAIIHEIYQRYRPSFIGIESVAANSAVYQYCHRLPMVVKPLSPLSKDKLVRATPAMALARDGRLFLPISAPWLDMAESEVLRFRGDETDAHDDIVDTLSYAVQCFQTLPKRAGQSPMVIQ